jgi:hypothetical protein
MRNRLSEAREKTVDDGEPAEPSAVGRVTKKDLPDRPKAKTKDQRPETQG